MISITPVITLPTATMAETFITNGTSQKKAGLGILYRQAMATKEPSK
jgi:hypothetical protein